MARAVQTSPPPTRARKTDAAVPRSSDCAAEVLEVVPAVMDALRGAMRRQVGEQWSVPQFRCLNFIAHAPGSSIGEVAAYLGVSMPTASAMVDRLVRAGAVEPRVAALDRRRSELHLTEAGRQQLQQIERGARQELERVLRACSRDELSTLSAGLAVLRQSFQSS